MDTLRIDSGTVSLTINDDPNRVISFDPTDVVFIEHLYQLMKEFEEQAKQYEQKALLLDEGVAVDDNNIPTNLAERIALTKEVCQFVRLKIDEVFGKGTAQTVFGDSYTLLSLGQFFDGLTPYIQKARQKQVAKYSPSGTRGRKVMS